MRTATAPILAALTLTLLVPPTLYAADAHPVDETSLKSLAEKAEHASLRDQCYLYAQLIREGTEFANQRLAAGDSAAATAALHSVELYAAALDTSLARDGKKLKDAEILLRESSFKLKAAMLAASIDDRPAMDSALAKVNAVEVRVMGTVFSH